MGHIDELSLGGDIQAENVALSTVMLLTTMGLAKIT